MMSSKANVIKPKAHVPNTGHQSKQPIIKNTNTKIQHFPQQGNKKFNKSESAPLKVPIVNLTKTSASAPTTPQQKRTSLPVKARRVERRKDIKAMAEAIKSELSETAVSTESDDSSSSDSYFSRSKNNNNNSGESKKSTNNKKRQSRRRSSSAVDVRSPVYAGPTFNNAPAPSALPIPAFSPTLVSSNFMRSELQRHSKDLMELLSPPQTVSTTLKDFDMNLSEIQEGLKSMLRI